MADETSSRERLAINRLASAATKRLRTASLLCTDGPSGERKFDFITTEGQQTLRFPSYFSIHAEWSRSTVGSPFRKMSIGLSHDQRPINGSILELAICSRMTGNPHLTAWPESPWRRGPLDLAIEAASN
jgi:hypothetical protein